MPNVVAINIVDFDFPPGGNFHTCFHLREDTDPSLILSPALEIHFVNMVKWRRGEKDLNEPLNRWLTWFDERSPPELIAEVANMDSAIMAAYMQQDFITQNKEAWQDYWMQRKVEHDRISNLNGARREGEEIGQQRGQQLGREEKALEIARKMKTAGRPCSEIEEFTGLPSDIIAQL